MNREKKILRLLGFYQSPKLTVVRNLVTSHVFCFALATGELKVRCVIIFNNCTESPTGLGFVLVFLFLPLPSSPHFYPVVRYLFL